MSVQSHNVDALVSAWMKRLGVPQSGNIPVASAAIGWSECRSAGVHGVIVVDVAGLPSAPGGDPCDTGTPDADRAAWRRAERISGACSPDWMRRPRFTPERLFCEWMLEGRLRHRAETIRALKQFAKIKECQWARRALAGLVDPDHVADDECGTPYPLRNNYAYHALQLWP